MSKDANVCLVCSKSGQKRERNGRWLGGRTYHKRGYLYVRTEDGQYVFEHRLVMEEMLGRSLLKEESVHHINGVKDDNRPENLELWVRPQPSGIRVEDAVKWAKEILRRYEGS